MNLETRWTILFFHIANIYVMANTSIMKILRTSYPSECTKGLPMHYAPEISKCEVKDWLCWKSIILLPLRFSVNWILGISNGPKMSCLAILGVLNFDFSKFEQLSSIKICQNSKFRVYKIAKNDIFGPFEFTKVWFHVISKRQ